MIVVYRDTNANAVVVKSQVDGTLGMFFNNELRAVGNEDGTIQVSNVGKSAAQGDNSFREIGSLPFASFVDESEVPLGADEVSTVNALNAIFQFTGGAVGQPPVITSSTSIVVAAGDQVNYTLEAIGGVGYEWDNLPAGLVVSTANPRKLLGSITAGAGTYNITMKAINYYGSDTRTLTISSTASYANTKSINFATQDYLGANAGGGVASIFERASNGSGSGDAWTVAMWYKGSTDNRAQTIFYYGHSDVTNNGHFRIQQQAYQGLKRLRIRYGTAHNHLQFTTPSGSITPGTWHHIMVTYDGGTTGSASGSVPSYYSRFKVYIDGVPQTRNNTHQNYGYSGSIVGQNFRLGRLTSGSWMRGCRVDEVAVWGSDQQSNVSSIYNSGAVQDLSALSTPPDHWWRMGDGDTYPTIQDNIGSTHFVMYNMTAADIVNDAP